MALARISRCHPLGGHGIDPPPFCPRQQNPWYTPWHYGNWCGPEEVKQDDPDEIIREK